MAHIADLMVDTNLTVGLNNYIARELSPHSRQDDPKETPTEEKEKFVWRMQQPAGPRKFLLFPGKDKLSIAAGRKSPDVEISIAVPVVQNGLTEKERLSHGGRLQLKAKEQTIPRRKKASIPELGPMTTVQEVPMDSPTIPGRPPLHERSISAPGNTWRQHVFGESMLSCISGPALEETSELSLQEPTQTQTQLICDDCQNTPKQTENSATIQPISPKTLAPLIIPSTSTRQPKLSRKLSSSSRMRGDSSPPEVPPKSARMLEGSPHSRATQYTPNSASTTATTSTAPTSVNNTPLPSISSSTQLASSRGGRSSPQPASAGPTCGTGHSRVQSESTQRPTHTFGHRRGESEGGQSIMDRGRPKRRADGSMIKRKPSVHSVEEQKAFETLPQGVKASEASSVLPETEIEALLKQAVGQASRFEVLTSKDVDALSRELRSLDERCEYLRKTHRSLRSGRRNLHDRICTYLRSPRVARFSHDSILKQEEALSELDRSIDDWVSKLELAENRRTRVRQKLLEHVAGALIMQPKFSEGEECKSVRERKSTIELQTPPRSPTKSQSPQRLAAPVQVSSPEPMLRRDVESIRIYADSDISALLRDVEAEITRMGEESGEGRDTPTPTPEGRLGRTVDESDTIAAGITLNAVTFQAQPQAIRISNSV